MPDYFGSNIDAEIQEWFRVPFQDEMIEKYGEDTQLAAMILPPMRLSLIPQLVSCSYGLVLVSHDDEKVLGSDGLVDNVIHKLNFVLRTGLPSSEARLRPDLVEPGDFPRAGAGIYRGYTGGVSGLHEESDWWAFQRLIDRLIEFRATAALPAINASKERVPGMKYMLG